MKKISLCFWFALISFFSIHVASACTRALWTNSGYGVLSGRTMDWPARSQPELWVFPRGMHRQGSPSGNSLNWDSKYGSIVTSAYHDAAVDGMNEKGLAAHVLWLDESDYGIRDPALPGLALSLWAQYYLDNFSSVSEALNATQAHPFQVLATFYQPMNRWMKLHLVLEDASGDSAIIEYVQGKMNVYHSHSNIIVTNSPEFPAQLSNLKNYQNFGGSAPLPGSGKPSDRFVRATYYTERLPKAHSQAEAVMMLRGVMHNVAQPYRAIIDDTTSSPTDWTAIDDLTRQIYYFSPTDTENHLLVDLNKMNFNTSAPVLHLDPLNNQWHGNVSHHFTPAEPFTPLLPTNV
ncbi:MAG: choloylglycine hydrolase [Gammaproteobacteria bacterium]|jgi:choloylglycine hydrolase|nr:choloylglycine hydrolase [Gammaproteobacteria bacterium]